MNANTPTARVPDFHRPCYPGMVQAIVLLLVCVGFFLLLSIPLAIIEGIVGIETKDSPLMAALYSIVAIGLTLRFGLRRTKAPFGEVFPLRPVRLALLPPMCLVVLGVVILLSEWDNLLRTFLPVPDWFAKLFSDLIQTGPKLWISVLALVIVPPLTEEPLFRGIILRGFLSRYATGKAVVLSALLFGIFHLNPWQFFGATVWGILAGWWYVETRSLIPCLFGHAVGNAIPLLGSMLPFEVAGLTSGLSEKVEFQPVWLDAMGLVMAGAGIWLLVRMFRAAKPLRPKNEAGR